MRTILGRKKQVKKKACIKMPEHFTKEEGEYDGKSPFHPWNSVPSGSNPPNPGVNPLDYPSRTRPSWRNTCLPFAVGAFVGAVLAYNIMLHQLKYRISFYGYHQVGGNVYPLIKLRKILSHQDMNYRDRGQEIDIVTMGLKQSVTFTDKEIEDMIKKEYCR